MHSERYFFILDFPRVCVPILQKLDGTRSKREEVIRELELEHIKWILHPSEYAKEYKGKQ
jgi:hypothetical protein